MVTTGDLQLEVGAHESTTVAVVLTPGEHHDAVAFDELLDAVPPDCRPEKATANTPSNLSS